MTKRGYSFLGPDGVVLEAFKDLTDKTFTMPDGTTPEHLMANKSIVNLASRVVELALNDDPNFRFESVTSVIEMALAFELIGPPEDIIKGICYNKS